MCELAAAGADGDWLSVSSAEIERPGPSYTVETLRRLTAQGAAEELVLLLGADQAASLPDWRGPEEVLRLASVAVARRAGVDEEALHETVTSLAGGERTRFFGMPLIEVSSSDVRSRVAEGRPYRFLVPERVADRIAERRLYTIAGGGDA
jgi:nicotinate-nucleotide adenylyltransferase